jgi:hypothetical protein
MVSVQLCPSLFLTTCNGDNLMHPPKNVCTHISIHKTIIEDHKLVCNQSTKYFTIAKNNHYSNLDIDTIDHEKTIECTTHHVFQEITVGMIKKWCRWWCKCASPRGRGGHDEGGDTAAAMQGSASPAAVQGAPAAAGPRGVPPPCPPSSLDLLGTIDEPSPLEMASKGEANS